MFSFPLDLHADGSFSERKLSAANTLSKFKPFMFSTNICNKVTLLYWKYLSRQWIFLIHLVVPCKYWEWNFTAWALCFIGWFSTSISFNWTAAHSAWIPTDKLHQKKDITSIILISKLEQLLFLWSSWFLTVKNILTNAKYYFTYHSNWAICICSNR